MVRDFEGDACGCAFNFSWKDRYGGERIHIASGGVRGCAGRDDGVFMKELNLHDIESERSQRRGSVGPCDWKSRGFAGSDRCFETIRGFNGEGESREIDDDVVVPTGGSTVDVLCVGGIGEKDGGCVRCVMGGQVHAIAGEYDVDCAASQGMYKRVIVA